MFGEKISLLVCIVLLITLATPQHVFHFLKLFVSCLSIQGKKTNKDKKPNIPFLMHQWPLIPSRFLHLDPTPAAAWRRFIESFDIGGEDRGLPGVRRGLFENKGPIVGRQAVVTAMFISSMDHIAMLTWPPDGMCQLVGHFLTRHFGNLWMGLCGHGETYRLDPTASCRVELLG